MTQFTWTVGMKLSADEPDKIRATMAHYSGNKTKAADALGISVRTLDAKLEKMRVDDEAHAARVEEARIKREEFMARSRGIPASAQYDTAATPRTFTR